MYDSTNGLQQCSLIEKHLGTQIFRRLRTAKWPINPSGDTLNDTDMFYDHGTERCQSIVRSFLYLDTKTWPDIATAASILGTYVPYP